MTKDMIGALALALLSLNLFLLSFLSFHSSEVLAVGTGTSSVEIRETIQSTETLSDQKENHTHDKEVALTEGISTETIWFGFEEEVSIATRHETPVGKAPSVVTVITAEEIKNLGYRTFVEILRTVPGFEILKRGDYGIVVPAVRGVAGENKIRVMFNGHFINYPLWGDAFMYFEDFPVENIKRIEIIRGPGSAVYGENAFLAVINIITFDAKDIDGVRVSSGYGSFDTYDENTVFGKTNGSVEISGMAHYRQTNGFRSTIQQDTQTVIDKRISPLGFPATSEAPGRVEDWRQEFDTNLKIVYKGFYVEGLYVNKNHSPFLGPQYVLTDDSRVDLNYVFGEAGYKKNFDERLTLRPRMYYDQFDRNGQFELLPEGAILPLDTNKDKVFDTFYTYPNGLVGNTEVSEKIVGTEIPFDFKLFDENIFTFGLEYRLINQTNIGYSTNFHPRTYEPLDSFTDFSDSYPFIKDATRRIWALYLQDTWDITDNLNLTLGVRHDQYSDFGGATSPRAGLTWVFIKNASLKLLYGEAFRAPNFREMFTTNQPAIQGNPDLDPEKIKTYEIGLSYQFNKYIASSINYFYNDIRDLIVIQTLSSTQSTSRYENFGDARIQGIEMETKVDIYKDNYIFMNYTFQNPEDDRGNDLPFVAQHHGNFGVNVHYWKYINTNLSTFVSGTRSREQDDSRDDLPVYALLNLSVIAKEFFKTMEIQGTVFNLLDKDYSDPGPTSIPDDLPRPERTFFVGLSYHF